MCKDPLALFDEKSNFTQDDTNFMKKVFFLCFFLLSKNKLSYYSCFEVKLEEESPHTIKRLASNGCWIPIGSNESATETILSWFILGERWNVKVDLLKIILLLSWFDKPSSGKP